LTEGTTLELKLMSGLKSGLTSSLFEDLVENFPDIIHSVSKDGRIISTNRRAEELLEYSKDELIGMEIYQIYADEIQPLVRKGFEDLKSSGFNQAIESKLKSKTGQIIEVEIRSFSLYDSENNFDRTFSIIRDIREKKRLQAQVYQQSKLAGIGELAAGIVHDIRNPLSIIMSLTRTGLKKAAESGNTEQLLEIRTKMEKAAERINRLCSHLRDYTRQEHESKAQTHIKALIEDCLLICENRIQGNKVKVSHNVADAELQFSLPANGLEQALINIVSNGCDAVADRPVREIRIHFEANHDHVTFKIEDSGPGVPEKVRAQIFDSFFTTKPKGQGTGLGLSICKGIIEEHGGTLTLDEKYTGGARFILQLPLNSPPFAADSP
jgi:two-component system NtrC family sensor kinase